MWQQTTTNIKRQQHTKDLAKRQHDNRHQWITKGINKQQTTRDGKRRQETAKTTIHDKKRYKYKEQQESTRNDKKSETTKDDNRQKQTGKNDRQRQATMSSNNRPYESSNPPASA